MSLVMTEEEMKEKAITYLQVEYGEDTVSMDVKSNGVEDGTACST